MPGISLSAEILFKGGASSSSIHSKHMKPVYRKEQQQKKRKGNLDNDLIEITGKKTKPLWHTIALEAATLNIGPMSGRRRVSEPESFGLADLLNKRNRPVDRSNSEQLLINIKASVKANVKPSNSLFEMQMDMLLARDAGFTSVKEHKAFLDTQKPHWYKDMLMEAYKMGVLNNDEVVKAFESLGRYYDTTRTSLVLPKSKLCFLVMSLPVWDVCQVALQRAVDYYLYIILQNSCETPILSEWLRTRKLPYLVRKPMTTEMQFLNQQTVTQRNSTTSKAD
ncbi:hypothetical protein EGW08_000452 [Elysia chlorotica]|uniref:Uncharacterized protein n=1 Tax=Elysia chlorotica TaxID=188477 RepID=A0A3S1A159_ELYCH|nr:hypothetical protein EGW08_000452 [Elysia chlorotica]